MDEKLLALPWQVQVALASGYTAYMASYLGIREHHKSVDVIFRALAFGLIAVGILQLSPPCHPVSAIIAAFLTTLSAGLLWRKYGRDFYRKFLREFDVSWADDTPSAWARMQEDSHYPISQISVLTDDDTWLFCEDASRYSGEPYGPCILGTNGDIIMYVDKSENKDGQVNTVEGVIDPGWGALASYIPASKIKQVSIRRIRDAIGLSAGAEGKAVVPPVPTAESTSPDSDGSALSAEEPPPSD